MLDGLCSVCYYIIIVNLHKEFHMKSALLTALALVYIVSMALAGSYFLAKSANLLILKNNVTLQNKN